MVEEDIEKIEDIFRRRITRRINKVVKVDQEDEDIVKQELEEYILTDVLEGSYLEILENIRDTADVETDEIGLWISGFFGSGKSHFMKILGYLLENKKLPHGEHAIEIFKQRTDDEMLKGAIERVDSLFDSEVLMFQIGSKENKRKADSISEIILREFNRKRGFAETPWVANIEKSLVEKGIYEDFKEEIKEQNDNYWESVRRDAFFVRNSIGKALVEVDPDFESVEEVERSIEDVKADLRISPEGVAEELNRYVEKKESDKEPRFFVFLDEISQFIGDDEEKLLELQSIAESFGMIGKGKLWLGVTSQEELKELIPGILAKEKEVSKVMDRFTHRVNLTSEEIDKVVRERVLKKKPDAKPELEQLHDSYTGLLSSNYKINSSRSLKSINKENFIECYPFVPYQIDILPSIFAGLRGKEDESQITGRERTMIDVIHSVFNEPIEFKERGIGDIISLDLIFDEIKGEIKDRDVSVIEGVSLEDGDDEVGRKVLKALYLLQQLDWVPNTPENITTGLFTKIGESGKLESDVKKTLDGLRDAGYIDKTDEGYRFLSETERNLREEIEGVDVRAGDVKRKTKKILSDLFENVTPVKYGNQHNSLFDISIKADGEGIVSKGDIGLLLTSPIYRLTDDRDPRVIKTQSHEEKERIYWIAESEDKEELEDDIIELIRSKQVISEKMGEKLSPEKENAVEKKAQDIDRLEEDIRRGLRKSFKKGIIIYYGDEYDLEKTEGGLEKHLNVVTDEVIPRVYSKLEIGLADVKDDDVESVFEDIEGGSLPGVFEELGLIVNGEVNTESPICKKINEEVKQNEELKGKEILEEFEGKPYGWPTNVIRLGVAALFRNGEVVPRYKENRYVDFTDSSAQKLFTGKRKFDNTIFEEQESVSPERRKEARDLLNKLFKERVRDTVSEIKDGIKEKTKEKSQECKNLVSELEQIGFPLSGDLRELDSHLESISAKQTPARIIETFLDLEEELEELTKTADEIIGFKEDGRLEKYQTFDRFLRDDWKEFEGLSGKSELIELDEEMKEVAERMRDTLDSKEVIEEWTDAKTDHQKIAREYVETYKELYEKRNDVYSEAIEEVKKYGDELKDEELESVLRELKEKKGDEELEIDISKGEHVDLDPNIERLTEHIKTVGSYIDEAKDKIDKMLEGDDGDGVETYTFDFYREIPFEEVQDEEDLEKVLNWLEKELKEKLEGEKEIKIKFR